jgi:hypothetical protein
MFINWFKSKKSDSNIQNKLQLNDEKISNLLLNFNKSNLTTQTHFYGVGGGIGCEYVYTVDNFQISKSSFTLSRVCGLFNLKEFLDPLGRGQKHPF